MRNFRFVIRAFAAATALTMLVGCEEVDPPKPSRVVVSTPAIPPSPASTATPAPPPAEVKPAVRVADEKAPPKVEPTQPGDDGTVPSDLIAGARAALADGELDRALRLAKLAVAKMPERSAAHNTLGRVQLRLGERSRAIASFDKAVELNPSSSYAYNNLGLALVYDGRFEDAVDALEEATNLTPVEGYMFNNLGMAYEHLDRLVEARDAYHKAADLKAERARENLARLQGVKSIRTARAEIQPSPDDAHDETIPVGMFLDGGVK
jgi:Flp pilus assembly protein TadD